MSTPAKPNLGKDIRSNVKSGTRIRAEVVDVLSGKATVRLLANGAVYHKLDVTGGPVSVGQTVIADFTSTPPTVVASGPLAQSDTPDPKYPDVPFKVPPRAKENTIKIYHTVGGTTEFIGTVEGINFVDGT